jgi:YD repeat-containing protein
LTLTGLSVSSNAQALINEVDGHADDRVTSYVYDRVNRRIEESIITTYATVDAATGALTSHTGPVATQYHYDAAGNLVAKIAAYGGQIDYAYDAVSRLVREQSPSFSDYTGQTVRTTVEYTYDGTSNVTIKTAKGATTAEDQITRYEYDPAGNLTKETEALGNPVRYFYDLNGNISAKRTRRDNPDGTQPSVDTLYTYDKLNRQSRPRTRLTSSTT